MIRYLFIAVVYLLSSCTPLQQKPEATPVQKKPMPLEQLKFKIPEGWEIVHQNSNEQQHSTQIIKAGETLDNWTIMITAQTILAAEKYDPESFIDQLSENAQQTCGNVRLFDDTSGVHDGYPYIQKMLACLPNKTTLKNERINIKAIKGKEAFYVLKVAYRKPLNRDEAFYWMAYLKDVTVVSTHP
jgi:hypothetical protein